MKYLQFWACFSLSFATCGAMASECGTEKVDFIFITDKLAVICPEGVAYLHTKKDSFIGHKISCEKPNGGGLALKPIGTTLGRNYQLCMSELLKKERAKTNQLRKDFDDLANVINTLNKTDESLNEDEQ